MLAILTRDESFHVPLKRPFPARGAEALSGAEALKLVALYNALFVALLARPPRAGGARRRSTDPVKELLDRVRRAPRQALPPRERPALHASRLLLRAFGLDRDELARSESESAVSVRARRPRWSAIASP